MTWSLWRPKVLADTVFPFLTISAILGFGVFQYPIGRPRFIFSIIYTIIVSCMFWGAFVKFTIQSVEHGDFSRASSNTYRLSHYGNQLVTAAIKIVNLWRAKKIWRVVDRLRKVDETLYKLGADFDYRQGLLVGTVIFSFWVLCIIAQIVSRVLWHLDPMSLQISIIMTILHQYSVTISIITGAQFWFMAWYIGQKFYALNKLLSEPFKHIYRGFENDDFATTLQKKFHVTSFNMALCRHLINDVDRRSFIQIIKHVHLELALITRELNAAYAELTVLEFAQDFVLFTVRFYLLSNILARPHIKKGFIITISTLAWLIPCLFKIISTNSISDSVTAEAKRTGILIFHFTQAGDDPEFIAEIRQFGLQLYNVPVRFSPLGIFVLGYRFVKGFFGTVLTYLIIIIQIDNGESL